ncbi:uncharacterized protein EURHEDRAFT_413078 [Aspergillus ruber CBS 135680]|uniref:Uncharacterized protein n=1 Tax=Aspergillus ruber (strain CBS 135680) TaxID=1388766 RepID=A0A017SDJ4_ASPRC|nr:uncharacterized protein EURHEDRAFT_413078 [Aspergillus ruber CBS 135680]EYE94709.1 hypothetical protein EURHEDRAFT_413078 [Aspergillus ruber CBS 135680]
MINSKPPQLASITTSSPQTSSKKCSPKQSTPTPTSPQPSLPGTNPLPLLPRLNLHILHTRFTRSARLLRKLRRWKRHTDGSCCAESTVVRVCHFCLADPYLHHGRLAPIFPAAVILCRGTLDAVAALGV